MDLVALFTISLTYQKTPHPALHATLSPTGEGIRQSIYSPLSLLRERGRR
jgi:hypothetical protein